MPGAQVYAALDRHRFAALLSVTVGDDAVMPLYPILETVKTGLRWFASGVNRAAMVGLVPQTARLDSASTTCG